MTKQVIEVIVDLQGETKIETRGFAGSSCRQASAFLESALGIQIEERLTSEFHEANASQQQLRSNSDR